MPCRRPTAEVVPEEGKFPVPPTTRCTFTAASGAVPLAERAFTILDERGRLPTGNGRLRWAPTGAKPIVSWDFDVEID